MSRPPSMTGRPPGRTASSASRTPVRSPHPTHNGRMGQRQAALGHHLHQVSQAQLEAKIPAHAQDDDLAVKVATLEQLLDAHQLAHAHPSGSSADIIAAQILPFAPEPPRRGQRLSRADDPRGQGPNAALQPDLRPVQEGARRDPRTHVSGNNGEGPRADGQDGRRLEFGEPARALYRAGVAVQDDWSRQMRRSPSGTAIAIIAVVAIILVWMSTFVVDPTEQALVLRFGQPVRDLIGTPGLYFKMPFIDTAVYIDKRILALDDERQEVLVSDNQRLEVDAFVRYHIADPLLFYQSVGDTRGADAQLGGMLNSALRRSLSGASITDIVRDKRDALMADIRDQMIVGAKRFGLDVVDVRIKRADLPAENSEAVFRRMQTERQQRAASYRAQGSQQSQQIKAEADRKVTVITAEAQQQSDQVRGEGDGERNRIFAEAYGADPEFFGFYRSMQAYENSFANGRTRALISPKSDFFRYFSTPNPAPQTATPPAPSASSAPSAKAD